MVKSSASSTAATPPPSGGWLAARSPAWRARIQVVEIDPSAAFRRAIVQQLPDALISVDPFHLVQLANLMPTRVRQRLVREGTPPRPRRRSGLGPPHPAAA
jgi:transposase